MMSARMMVSGRVSVGGTRDDGLVARISRIVVVSCWFLVVVSRFSSLKLILKLFKIF